MLVKDINLSDTMSVNSSLPSYHRTEEWYTTLLELQTHLVQMKSRREAEGAGSILRRSKQDEVEEAVIQSVLRQLGIIISDPDSQRRLNTWADIVNDGPDGMREKVFTALEKSLPLLLDAPPKHAKNIIAAAAASVDEESDSEDFGVNDTNRYSMNTDLSFNIDPYYAA